MVVRQYQADDLVTVVAIFQRSVREIASLDYTREQTTAWAPDIPDLAAWSQRLGNENVFVCEHRGQLAGFASVMPSGHIALLYVHPESKRQGVAGALCEHIVEWAMARKVKQLFTEASVTARPFFERHGFRMVRAQVVEARGVSMTNFQMERAL